MSAEPAEIRYRPVPGTLPARALPWLAQLPPGTMVATAELAEAMDVSCQAVTAGLETAIREKAVRTEMRGRIRYWGPPGPEPLPIPTFVPSPAPAAAAAPALTLEIPLPPKSPPPPAPAEPERFSVETPLPRRLVPPAAEILKGYANVAQEAAEEQEKADEPARFAFWSNGALELRRGSASRMVLLPDETRALLRYLDRMREDAA